MGWGWLEILAGAGGAHASGWRPHAVVDKTRQETRQEHILVLALLLAWIAASKPPLRCLLGPAWLSARARFRPALPLPASVQRRRSRGLGTKIGSAYSGESSLPVGKAGQPACMGCRRNRRNVQAEQPTIRATT